MAIDPAELTRAYELSAPPAPLPADTGAPDVRERLARAEAMVEVLERQVGDLQRRLDEAERERRELQGKALTLIEDRARQCELVEKAVAKLTEITAEVRRSRRNRSAPTRLAFEAHA